MNLLVKILAVVGVLAILVAGILLLLGLLSLGVGGVVPGTTLLELDFEQGMIEYVPNQPLAKVLLGGRMTTRAVVEALVRAADDDRVVGVVARVGSAPLGLAVVQELRDAVEAFRAAGKPAVAYAETFGEFGNGTAGYYLATAFDEIYLQPSGDINLTGLMYEHPFLRGVLDKLDVVPRMDQRFEYKNAMNLYTEREFTEAHREATRTMVESQFGQIVRGIAAARGKSEAEVRALADRGIYLGSEALDAGLVDGLAYRDEVLEKLRARTGGEAELLYPGPYLDRAGGAWRRGRGIALVFGVGPIYRGRSTFDPYTEAVTMGSDTVAAGLRAAVDDDDVEAIVFRVDCNGGSYVGSDAVLREVIRARAAGKPVVVTMGNVAASGGYFVAMEADAIVAQPATITASIGVLGGKMITTGLWDKVGLSFDEVHTSRNGTFYSTHHDYSPSEYERLQAFLDRVYEDFTHKVASSREIPLEKVLEIAKGRVWTGEDAQRLGLVDHLGGFLKAIELAREAAGIGKDEPIHLRAFPREKTFFQTLTGAAPESSDREATTAIVAEAFEGLRPYARLARRLGLGEAGGVLSAPIAAEGAP